MELDWRNRMLVEKMDKQKLINGSLEILLKFAENSMRTAKESIVMVGKTFEDYQSEDYTILKEYQTRYKNLKKQLNIPFDYMTENGSD